MAMELIGERVFDILSNNLFRFPLLSRAFLLVGENNLLSGRVVRVQTDYYSYEFGLCKLEVRV